jgi:hypothetical protein
MDPPSDSELLNVFAPAPLIDDRAATGTVDLSSVEARAGEVELTPPVWAEPDMKATPTEDEADAAVDRPAPPPKRSVAKPAKKTNPVGVSKPNPGLEPFTRIFGPPRPGADVITTTNSK